MMHPSENDWKALPPVAALGSTTILAMSWGGGNRYLAINCVRQVFILTEQDLAAGYCDGVSALQTSPSDVEVRFHGRKGGGDGKADQTLSLKVPIQVVFLDPLVFFIENNSGIRVL